MHCYSMESIFDSIINYILPNLSKDSPFYHFLLGIGEIFLLLTALSNFS